MVTVCPIFVTSCLGLWVTPAAALGSVDGDGVWKHDKEHKRNHNWKYPEMQILYFWGLTHSQETKGHTAEEPGGHGRVGQEEASPRGGPRGHEQEGLRF